MSTNEGDVNKGATQAGGAKQAPPTSQTSPPAQSDAPKLYVDGKAVPEEAYFTLAGQNGYDVEFLRSHPDRRPSFNTASEVKK
jgi:hypothetical protein